MEPMDYLNERFLKWRHFRAFPDNFAGHKTMPSVEAAGPFLRGQRGQELRRRFGKLLPAPAHVGDAVIEDLRVDALLVPHLLAQVRDASLLGLGARGIRARLEQKGLLAQLALQVLEEVCRIGAAAQLCPVPVDLELLVRSAVARLDLALQVAGLCHVWHRHAQVDATGLAHGVQHHGVLGAALAGHAQRDLLLVDVLEARGVVLRLLQKQGALPGDFLPLAVSGLAAPLAVLAGQLQRLTELPHGLVHQKQALCRPQGATIVGVELPVHPCLCLLVIGLVRQLLARVAEHGVGAVLVEVELLAVHGVDVGVAEDATTPARGEPADAPGASEVDLSRDSRRDSHKGYIRYM